MQDQPALPDSPPASALPLQGSEQSMSLLQAGACAISHARMSSFPHALASVEQVRRYIAVITGLCVP